MRVVPAILTESKQALISMLNVCAEFTDYVQVDIMDGKFVPSLSIDRAELSSISLPVRGEVHLMTVDPGAWLDSCAKSGAERVIYHYEINGDHKRIISDIRSMGLSPGIAVNPDTGIDEISGIVESVDVILFMSVVPGFYGSKFIPAVLRKISRFRELFPDIKTETGIDGGVKMDNAGRIMKLGLDYICVGSAILKSPDPAKAYREFTALKND